MMGVIQVSVDVIQPMVNYDFIDLMLGILRNSTGITSKSSASLVDASRAKASACGLCSLGTCRIVKELNVLNRSLAFCK